MMKAHGLLALGMVATALSTSVWAEQTPQSSVQYLRPTDLSQANNQVPGTQHGHVRQRLAYGKGYRYGHSSSGALGDIIIWSASPNQIHGSQPIMRIDGYRRPSPTNATGYALKYKPQYGKTPKPGYGQ